MPMNKIPRTITVTQLTNFMYKCQRRLWLNLHGNEADNVMLDPDQERWMQQGNLHEQQVVTTCYGPARSVSVPNWPDLVRQTREWMDEGISPILQGGLEVPLQSSRLLIGKPDVLVRADTPSKIGAWHYRPIEIKSYRDKKKRMYFNSNAIAGCSITSRAWNQSVNSGWVQTRPRQPRWFLSFRLTCRYPLKRCQWRG